VGGRLGTNSSSVDFRRRTRIKLFQEKGKHSTVHWGGPPNNLTKKKNHNKKKREGGWKKKGKDESEKKKKDFGGSHVKGCIRKCEEELEK